jgi:hypothetical protein
MPRCCCHSESEETPLLARARSEHADQLLLGTDTALLNTDRAEANLLHYIVADQALEALRAIAKHPDLALAARQRDAFGLTPVDIARANGFDRHLQPLLEEQEEHNEPAYIPTQYLKKNHQIKLKLIVNPVSGKGKSLRVLNNKIAPMLTQKGIRFSIHSKLNYVVVLHN